MSWSVYLTPTLERNSGRSWIGRFGEAVTSSSDNENRDTEYRNL